MTVIDTNNNTSASLDALKARGVSAVGRYYSSRASKRVTQAEARAVSRAGLDLFCVFEDDGDPTLTSDQGMHDAQLALTQARAVGQPEGTAIYFALEHLPSGYTEQHLPAVVNYVTGLRQVLAGSYKIGLYSDGVVLKAMLESGLCDLGWLSASRGFPGSRAFFDSRRWVLAQDPNIDQHLDGLSVDFNLTNGEFGAFRLAAEAAPPLTPAGSFASRVVSVATGEWAFFGNQSYDIDGHREHAGHTEGEDGFAQRVGHYWLEGTNTHGVDGTVHDMPWSAAFISFVMREAQAAARFRYSTQHSVYISQGIRDFQQTREAAGYWTVRLGDEKPATGDLLCWSRQGGIDYDHQAGGNYAGHADLVVEVLADRVAVLGGNVGDSVSRRLFKLDQNGFLRGVNAGGETLFALMKCRIP